MFGLVNSDSMDAPIYEEFDRLERGIASFLITEHNEDGTHNMEPAGLGFVQIGFIGIWPSTTAPAGWHTCNGANISRTRFSALFNTTSTTFGVGDGSTTFGLPLIAAPGAGLIYIIFTGLGS